MTRLLEVDDLTVSFDTRHGRVTAVDGVSFALYRGRTLAVVGESGSGKTVTALSLMGLLPSPPARVERGAVMLGETSVLGMSERELADVRGARMAMVLQDPGSALDPVMRVGRQVAEVLTRHEGMSRAHAEAKAVELFAAAGISDPEARARDYPHRLSGGMRQRVLLAMAVACEPEVLIADEPTAALDVTTQAEVLESLKATRDRTGSALLLITHDMGLVAGCADHVAVMYAGRVVESGPVDVVFDGPMHPYTVGLLECVPRHDVSAATRPRPIEGQPPSLGSLPSGCAFHPRCPYATGACTSERPELRPVGRGHEAACRLARGREVAH